MTEHLYDDDDGVVDDPAVEVATGSRFDEPKLAESQLAEHTPRLSQRRVAMLALAAAGLVGGGIAYSATRAKATGAPRTVERRESRAYEAPAHLRNLGMSAEAPAPRPTEPCNGTVGDDGVCYPPDDQLPKAVLTAAAQPLPADPCPGCTPAQAIALEQARMKAAGDPDGRGKAYMGQHAANTGSSSGGARGRRDEESQGDATLAPIGISIGTAKTAQESTTVGATSGSVGLGMPMMPLTPPGGMQLPPGLKDAIEAAQGGQGDPDKTKEDFAAKSLQLDSENVPRELGECELTAGDVIHVANLTAINTDVPARATITASVTETVYCGADRQHVAIPAGARFTASANSRVAYGDDRIQVCMDQLRFPPSVDMPNGSIVATDCWAAADVSGMIGWTGEVDNDWPQLLGGIALSTLFSLGTSASAGNQEGWAPTVGQRAAAQAGGQLNAAGQRVTQRELQRKPTIVREALQSGAVIVTRNQPLRPWVGRKMHVKARPRWRR